MMRPKKKRWIILLLACGTGFAIVGGMINVLNGGAVAHSRALNTVYLVANTNDSGPGSLRTAIIDANASPGSDQISITVTGTLYLMSSLPVITDSVSVEGPGAHLFKVDGQDLYRIFDIGTVGASMSGLTIQRGNITGTSANGAGLRSGGDLALTNVAVISNTAQSGGGGLFGSGNLVVANSLFQNNTSTNGIGGGLRNSGRTIISETQFVSNTSQGDGGAVFALGEVILSDAVFDANRCQAGSCDGGGMFSFSQTTIENSQFVNNLAQDLGGALAAPGVLEITNGLFQNNHSAFGSGGGLFVEDRAVITATKFLSNTARSKGGGIYSLGDLTVIFGDFEANHTSLLEGGGIHAFGTLQLNGTRFLRNSAAAGGGLFHNFMAGSVVNGLFAGNQAASGSGAAMLLASPEAVEVLHVTISGTGLAGGSAIEVFSGTVGITNTIVISHTSGINNTGGSVHQDYNLFFGNGANTQGAVSGGSNSFTGNPLLVDLAGDDYHLSPGSAAIDAGINAGVLVDFEDEVRPQDNGFDIGFDEIDLASEPPPVQDYYLYLPVIQH